MYCMQHRAHPAQCWLSSCWHHHPIAAVVWGSWVRHSLGKGLLCPSPKYWVNSACSCVQLGWLHVGLVGFLSFEVNIQAGGHNGSWPQSSLPSCPRMSSMTKTFHVLLARIREEEWERVWRHWDVCESTLHGLSCSFTSHSTVCSWTNCNCTLRKCYIRMVEFEQQ